MRQVASMLASLKWPAVVLVFGIVAAWIVGGPAQALVVTILCILEVSLSFDNAVINATVLRRLNGYWRKIFLTVGMLIAVVGMRLVFPVAIVAVTAKLSFGAVIDLILLHPLEYAHQLELAHPSIAAFGGMFLLMIFLDFVLDEAKRVHWIAVIEEPLSQGGRLKTLSTLIALMLLLVVCSTWGQQEAELVLSSGVVGIVTYLAVRGFSQLFENLGGVSLEESGKHRNGGEVILLAGRAAFFLFLYLEVLDASFSFDGVVGAFAITSNVLTITLGLGIGAFFVRELTIWLVRHDTLSEFVYLEHGAHYAVGALAVLLAASLKYDIPQAVTGLVGVVFIVLSLVSSLNHRNRRAVV